MSEITIDDCIRKLNGLSVQIAMKGEEIMKSEVPVGKTGHLKESVTSTVYGDKVEIFPTVPYANYVEYGRGPIVPHKQRRNFKTGRFMSGTKSFLKWEEYNGSQTSIHHGGSGTVFARYAGPAEANDFEGRTKRRLEALIDAIWASV